MKTRITLAEKRISVLCHGCITIDESDGVCYYYFRPSNINRAEDDLINPVFLSITEVSFAKFISVCYEEITN